MHKLLMLASVAVLAASTVNCGNSSGQSTSLVSPSPVDGAQANSRKPGAGTGQPGTSTLTLALVTDVNGNGSPDWGDTVSFSASTPATNPHVSVQCSQGDAVVYNAYSAYSMPAVMTLSSMVWQGGAASCTATLYQGDDTRVYATLSFTAGGE